MSATTMMDQRAIYGSGSSRLQRTAQGRNQNAIRQAEVLKEILAVCDRDTDLFNRAKSILSRYDAEVVR